MGEYVFCPQSQELPAILSSAHLFGKESLALAAEPSASMRSRLATTAPSQKAMAALSPDPQFFKAERLSKRLPAAGTQSRLHLYQAS